MNEPDEAAVIAALRTLPDPEFGINIVDLGLVYDVKCTGGDVTVTMTLTTESCPAGNWIYEGAKNLVAGVPGVTHSQVNLVFEPHWSTAMLSADARKQLGLPEE
ncbi:MAG TPA: metal-sulfur cluster assembly factor [Opitutaceae bacterium]|nr:metal-sulfur cluster assembly factor [Opitutaceae bacterium]